jgi:putative transposase
MVYPQACKFLKLKNKKHHHIIHLSYETSVIEKIIQYIKDRTESFDDYFSCKKGKELQTRTLSLFNIFIHMHNRMISHYVVK